MEKIYGSEVAEMDKMLGQRDLRDEVADFNKKNMPGDTVLHIDLNGRHPDEGFSGIPYEKGANFLMLLEATFGRQKFDAYLKKYFHTYAFKTITTPASLVFMKRELFGGDELLWQKLKVEEWVYGKGIPDNIITPVSDKFEKTRAAAHSFMKTGSLDPVKKDWITAEWLDFLNSLPEKVSRERLEALDKERNLTKTGNAEILFAWEMICVRNNYEPAYPALKAFLNGMGRRKFLKPLYQAMQDNPKTRAMGKKIYAGARSGYHPISQTTIDDIVK
jgi:hypothetical protein